MKVCWVYLIETVSIYIRSFNLQLIYTTNNPWLIQLRVKKHARVCLWRVDHYVGWQINQRCWTLSRNIIWTHENKSLYVMHAISDVKKVKTWPGTNVMLSSWPTQKLDFGGDAPISDWSYFNRASPKGDPGIWNEWGVV